MNRFFVVDVESNGPCPGIYSMISLGAGVVDGKFNKTFYGQTKPISEKFEEEAYSVVGTDYETHLTYDDPEEVMKNFAKWLVENSDPKDRLTLWSDNPAFDWQWVNYYFHKYTGGNPFGFSARRIGDFYCGLQRDLRVASVWKSLRKTKHSHHPVDDAVGNAEALWILMGQI
jgi:hypothetical protein